MSPGSRTDEGSGVIWVLALAAVVVLVGSAVLSLVQVRVVRARAATAADLAALAAAARAPSPDACEVAARVAAAHGTVLSGCSVTGLTVDIAVSAPLTGALSELGVVRVRSRAGPSGVQ